MDHRGRPRKYLTDEERAAAIKEQKKKWTSKNKNTVDYIRAKSFAKKFIKMSDNEDLQMLEELIKEHKKQQKNKKGED